MKTLKRLLGPHPDGEMHTTTVVAVKTLVKFGDKLFAKHIDNWQQDMQMAEVAKSQHETKA